jgi:hypothetical protein
LSAAAAELGNSFGNFTDSPRVFRGRLLIGKGALSGGDQGGHTTGGHDQGLGLAPLLCGQPLAPLWLSFGLRSSSEKNKTSGTCFIQF